jgi:RNA-splicing ligase RtcB
MSDVKIFTYNIEEEAKQQINTLAAQSAFANEKIRIMPDVHAGKGCTVGFTSTYTDKIIPNIVGVDLSCGMLCYNFGKINLNLSVIDKICNLYFNLSLGEAHPYKYVNFDFSDLKMYGLHDEDYLLRSMGTIGSGNHFFEINKDDEGNIYFVVHSGSRNFGKQVADYYQQLAILNINKKYNNLDEQQKSLIQEYKATGRQKEIQEALQELKNNYQNVQKIPNGLCYLEGKELQNYLHDIEICKEYARLNRHQVMSIIISKYFIETGKFLLHIDEFETLHNYIDVKHKIIRKGAIAAYQGQKVLIPLNMRDGAIIAIGKGNEDWNYSAPHGAGRQMSRSKAKEVLSMDEYVQTMSGIYSSSVVPQTIDEAPMAYKPSEQIIELVQDTVEIQKVIKPIYNFKVKS